MARSLAGFVQKRGRSVTLRTFTEGAADADYGEPTWILTDTTIKAVRDVPKVNQVVRSAAGDEVAVDAVFYAADGDEPTIVPDVEKPRVIDGQEFEVIDVGQPELGVRPLNCKKVA